MRTAYINALFELAKEDSNVIALISDNGAIVYDLYRQELEGQYYNMGISEANMLGAAAGMARCGKIPFAYTIGAFLAYRALEFIRNDICLQDLNVKIVGTGAGVSYGGLGPTHHATEDLGALRSMPGLTVICPASPRETAKAVKAAYMLKGPVYLRLGTNREQEIYDSGYSFEVGKGIILSDGSDVTLLGMGSILQEVLMAAKLLEHDHISARVINIHTIKPIDGKIICNAARETRAVVTVEDHNIIGGLGSAAAEVLAEGGVGTRLLRLGLRESFARGYGACSEVRKENLLSAEHIYQAVKKLLDEGKED